jgi:hypothetical protein
MELITSYLKKFAADLEKDTSLFYWKNEIKEKYGMDTQIGEEDQGAAWILRKISLILNQVPEALVRACGVKKLIVRFLGENRAKFPNHGFYVYEDQSVTLNSDIFIHPDQPEDFIDKNRHFLTRTEQTLYHEFGHAADRNLVKGKELSSQEDWMKLSGWSREYKPGLKRLIIDEPGAPRVVGEYYFDPRAGFTRFYAKRNPWDDWADSWSFYVARMKDKVPENKSKYFDDLLTDYYK